MSSAINNAALPVIKTLLGKGVMRAAAYPSNLAQLLANLPRDGVGSRVVPESWVAQGITDSFYTITHVRLSPGMTQGIFSGVKTWQGKAEASIPRQIPSDLADNAWRIVPSQ